MTKKIIWTANSLFHQESLMVIIQNELPELEWDIFNSVAKTVPAIDSGNYKGTYVGDLYIPILGSISKFDLNDNERDSMFGGGLYLARYSVQKGLPTLVNALTTQEATDSRITGATILTFTSSPDYPRELIESFRKLFLK